MLDRLEEFRKLAQKEGASLTLNESLIGDEENNDRELIEDFLVHVKEVQKLIVQMSKKNSELKEICDQQINDNKSSNQQNKTEQITEIVQLNAKYQKKIKELLDVMTSDINEYKKNYPNEPETRVKQTVHRTLTSKFRDVLRQSQQIQTEYKNAMQTRIKRQLRIVKTDATEEELEQLARDPEAAQALIKEKVIGTAHRKIQNTVDDIQNKYRDILRLEQSVEELFQLFQELATLIQNQGELLDNIEANLQDANDYMEKAETHLIKAKKWHEKARTKMCCIMICMLVVMCILLFGVFKVQG
eukprot:403344351